MTGETTTATTRAGGRYREGELPGARTQVDDDRTDGQAHLAQEGDFRARAGVLLPVVAPDMGRVEVLPAGAGDLIERAATRLAAAGRGRSSCRHLAVSAPSAQHLRGCTAP